MEKAPVAFPRAALLLQAEVLAWALAGLHVGALLSEHLRDAQACLRLRWEDWECPPSRTLQQASPERAGVCLVTVVRAWPDVALRLCSGCDQAGLDSS